VLLFIGSIILLIYLRTYSLKQQRKKLILRVKERTREIEKQQVKLIQQAIKLQKSNTMLLEKQEEIHAQKESIEIQNLKLEHKNILLEEQKDHILEQKLQVEEMAEQLHQIDQMKLKFFTNISHEFRTPLSLIIGPLEKTLMDLQEDENEVVLNRLQIVYRNTLRLLRLINQFLDLSKIEEGAMKLKIASGEIKKYLEGIIEAYRYIAEQKNISLVFQAEHEIECFFDNDKIDKILYNLLSNAFKYTDNQGRILVSLDKYKIIKETGSEIPAIRITVEDNGRGIDEKHKMKIFERFYQAEDDGTSNSGTGIGLSLTHELVKIYRGTIHVESTLGYGSRFIVTLPCNKESFNENEIVREHILDTTLFRNLQVERFVSDTEKTGFTEQVETNDKPLVLIVEDNIDTIIHLREHLSPKFNLHVALDGNAGWNKAINLVPEAIISDVIMPSLNGFQLCEKLKNDDRTCHIPVILLTALADRTDQIEGFECGADEYIIKPFDMDILKVKVLNLIENREKLKHFFRKAVMYPPPDISIDSADDKLMRRVMKVLNDEISNPDFGVDELSKRVGLSRTHLYRKLLKITSQSPVELIRNTRLQRAAQLLRENKLYVAEVADMAGFKEISYFRKMFKDFYGLSPVEYSQSTKLV
jgi:signal transduction histidine kinase/DNA-binding response OmpR family regulator